MLYAVVGHTLGQCCVNLGAGILSSFSFLMPLSTYVYKTFVLFKILYYS